MERKRQLLIRRTLPLLTGALAACWASAQTTVPAPSQPSPELPAKVRAALESIEDYSFQFAQPGFYALLKYLKTTSKSPGHAREPIDVDDWTVLLERPADLRGLPITVEGVVGRNKAWRFEGDEYRRLGTVWQLELWRADQPIACTLILANEAGDIPINATVRVTGYFVMIRQYYSRTNRLRQAALLVADGPTLVSQPAATAGRGPRSNWLVGLVVAATTALIVIWILLRRSVARPRPRGPTLRASSPAPVSLANDLAAWAAEQADEPADDSAGAEPPGAPNKTGNEEGAGQADRA